MNIIRNLGIALSGHVENSTKVPADKILKLINDWNVHKQQIDEAIDKQRNMYTALYENPRLENAMKYNTYLADRAEVYNVWKKNGDKESLLELVKFSKPSFQDVSEIYTYTAINPYQPDRKPKEEQSKTKTTKIQKPTKTVVKKECPEGKIYNPTTGRCITDPSLKKAKVAKDVKEVKKEEPEVNKEIKEAKPKKPTKEKKECPEGKIYNPATGRCITDPSLKKAKEPKEKKTRKTEKEN